MYLTDIDRVIFSFGVKREEAIHQSTVYHILQLLLSELRRLRSP